MKTKRKKRKIYIFLKKSFIFAVYFVKTMQRKMYKTLLCKERVKNKIFLYFVTVGIYLIIIKTCRIPFKKIAKLYLYTYVLSVQSMHDHGEALPSSLWYLVRIALCSSVASLSGHVVATKPLLTF